MGWFLSKAAETAFQSLTSGHSILSLEKDDLVLPCGRVMLANKLQESGKCLQKTQRARSRGEGASHWQRGFELENCRVSEAALAGGHDAAEVETKATVLTVEKRHWERVGCRARSARV